MNGQSKGDYEMSVDLKKAVDLISSVRAPKESVDRLIDNSVGDSVNVRSSVSTSRSFRQNASSRMWKLALAAAIAGICLFFASGWLNNSNGVYASMQKVVSEFSTIQLVSTVFDGDGKIVATLTGFADERGFIRQESSDGVTVIADYIRERGMELFPAEKKARIFPMYQTDRSLEFFDAILGLLRGEEVDSAREVARQDVDGTTLVEFEVESAGTMASVFVDLNTNQPCKIEMEFGEAGPFIVIDQFVFDVSLAPEFFVLEAPDGFTVVEVEHVATDDSGLVLTPGIGLGPVEFGFNVSQVIEAFGEPEERGEADSKVFLDGEWRAQKIDVLSYTGRGLQIHVDPIHGVKTITAVDASGGFVNVQRAFAGALAAGNETLRMGDSFARVLELLGTPDQPEEFGKTANSLTYWEFENGVTTSVGFRESVIVSFSSHKEF